MKIKEWFECLSQTDSFYTEIWEDSEKGDVTLFYGDYEDLLTEHVGLCELEFQSIDIHIFGEGDLKVSVKI